MGFKRFITARFVRLAELLDRPARASFEEIRRNVGTFSARGGTIGWLASAEGVVVVDSQFADTARLFVTTLTERCDTSIEVLLNTHHHGDHTGGNLTLRPSVESIVAHENSARWQRIRASEQNVEAYQAYPDHIFSHGWTRQVGNEVISARYRGPAHTSGDITVTFGEANVVHMGDLLTNRVHPFVDTAAGSSIVNWIATLQAVVEEHARDTVYIVGHARPDLPAKTDRTEVLRFADYLGASLEFVATSIQAGLSKDEIIRTPSLKGFEDYRALVTSVQLSAVLSASFDELALKQ